MLVCYLFLSVLPFQSSFIYTVRSPCFIPSPQSSFILTGCEMLSTTIKTQRDLTTSEKIRGA